MDYVNYSVNVRFWVFNRKLKVAFWPLRVINAKKSPVTTRLFIIRILAKYYFIYLLVPLHNTRI